MTRREAKLRALSDAAAMLETASEGGWPDDLDDEDAEKAQAAMRELANELGRRFARLVLSDVRRTRKAATEPEGT